MSNFEIGTKITDENNDQYIIDDIKVIANDVGIFLRKISKSKTPITKVVSVSDLNKFKRLL